MQCTHCKKEKKSDCFQEFDSVVKGKRYRIKRHICYACLNQKSMGRQRDRFNGDEEARLDHRHKITQRSKMKRYGITAEYAYELLDNQGGCCAVCGQSVSFGRDTPRREQACIDHCHNSGDVRGILCSKCNSGLGMLNDDPSILSKAIEYLTK